MKKNLLLLGLIIFAISAFSQSSYYHFKFDVKDKNELKKITQLISIDNFKNNTVWAYANEKEFETFKELNYKIESLPLNDNNNKVINMATTTAQMANWDRYPTYDVYKQMMLNFQTNYPTLCDLDTIGNTQAGRLVLVLKISDNVSSHEQEPEFFYTSTMHGDETTGMLLTLRLADYLLSNYGTNPEATYIVNNFELYINPDANPDGTYYGGNNDVSGSRRSLYNGDDPNRDFPYPLDVNSTTSNPETNDMMAFATEHHFVMSANFHGGAEVYNYPWDCWNSSENTPADVNWWEHLGRAYVDSARLNYSSYMSDVTSDGVTEGADWYYASGSRQDYMNYFHHCKEVTIELSSSKTLSTDQLNNYWNYNKRSLINFIKEANYGFNGTVKNTNGDPLNAKIEITSYDKDNSWVVTDPVFGDYYRPIEPGTYDVTYSSYGYISQTHTITVSDWETTTIKDVVLIQANVVNVTGTVIEDGTSNPLEGVKIEIMDTPIDPVYSIANGTYTINDVLEDIYQIKASLSGYTSVIQTVDISTTTVIDFTLAISNAISFETEVPPIFTYDGDANWTRVTPEAYDGTYSMKSGDIGDDQTSVMQASLNITSAGNISFYKKVSSESGYDFLKFYIDGTEKGSWSGNVDWSQESYPVTSGVHTFKWEYSKDSGVSNGSDCAWVDYIEFPEYQLLENYTVTGTVEEDATGNPINGATISIVGTSYTGLTGVDGTYSIANVIEGTYDVIASANGFKQSLQNVSISSSNHDNINFALVVSNAISFETEIPSDFSFSGNLDWTRVNDKAYDGTWSMKSGAIVNNQSSIMEVTKNTEGGTISFYKFVSSENNYDFLKFYIDGLEKDSWSGTTQTNWDNATYNVAAGTHTYKWEYSKDGSASSGDDCAWVDYIEFLPSAVSIKNDLSGNSKFHISPNPFHNNTSFEFYINKKSKVFVGIYTYNGQLVKTIMNNEVDSGNHRVIWNGRNENNQQLANGLYFCKIINQGNSKTEKLILLK